MKGNLHQHLSLSLCKQKKNIAHEFALYCHEQEKKNPLKMKALLQCNGRKSNLEPLSSLFCFDDKIFTLHLFHRSDLLLQTFHYFHSRQKYVRSLILVVKCLPVSILTFDLIMLIYLMKFLLLPSSSWKTPKELNYTLLLPSFAELHK